ncbi:hypothetical protein PoB_004623200 [Plakobranchus ocellatus]|uniref:Uncharacterized protein n=1 Tax=Plakobranchus ocellatus TaxID=259542 RepID=A0AAV4BLC6_9GAST|nr:hypothetical protein PoB_004623200 [Plakobranchus ocellatus]
MWNLDIFDHFKAHARGRDFKNLDLRRHAWASSSNRQLPLHHKFIFPPQLLLRWVIRQPFWCCCYYHHSQLVYGGCTLHQKAWLCYLSVHLVTLNFCGNIGEPE